MIRRPPRSTQSRSSAASDVYKRQLFYQPFTGALSEGAPHVALDKVAFAGENEVITDCTRTGDGPCQSDGYLSYELVGGNEQVVFDFHASSFLQTKMNLSTRVSTRRAETTHMTIFRIQGLSPLKNIPKPTARNLGALAISPALHLRPSASARALK